LVLVLWGVWCGVGCFWGFGWLLCWCGCLVRVVGGWVGWFFVVLLVG
jgi:hypothetical protein